MIATSSAFSTANAKLAKQPTYVITIDGYHRAFANRKGLSLHVPIQSAKTAPGVGGLQLFSSTVTLTKKVTAGDPIFLFIDYFGTFGQEAITSVTDTGGHTWTSIFSNLTGTTTGAWYAIANADYPAGITISINGHVSGFLTGGNFEIYAVEVASSYSGFLYGSATGPTGPASVTAGVTTLSYNASATFASPWKLVLIELAPASGSIQSTTITFAVTPTFPPGNLIQSGSNAVVGNGQVDDWLKTIDDLKQTIDDLNGSSNLADLVFNVLDFNQLITADMPSFVFEGKGCTLLSGFVGMTIPQFATLFTGVIDRVESDNSNLEYKFTVPSKNAKKLSQVIYATGDDGFPIDSKHPRTVSGHPLDIFVSALQQCGIPSSEIDTAKIDYYRNGIFNGLEYLFSLTSAPVAKDFIENELMMPLAMYWRENNLSIVTVSAFYPALSASSGYTPPTYPQATLDSSVITDVPLEQQAELVDQITFRLDDNGNGFDYETVQTWATAVTKYGLYGGQIIESKGMRSSFQGSFMAQFIARLIFLRYGNKPIVLDPLPLLWSECVLEPGDIIAVTLPYIPDRQAGVLGVTTKAFEVLDRNLRFTDGICEPKLLEIDLSPFKQFLITPNAEADFTADSPTNQAKYLYLSDQSGKYSDGSTANTLC